ncbi:MAG TPA: hypothetical protein VEP50_10215 [bacterium]|nr:hypothetical protein [bacterium]
MTAIERSRSWSAALASGAGACVVIAILLWGCITPARGFLALGIAVVVALLWIPLLVASARGWIDPFEPAVLVSFFYAVGFPVGTVMALRVGIEFDPAASLAWFPAALGVAAVGLGAWFLGYYAGPGAGLARVLPPVPSEWNGSRVTAAVAGLALVGWAAQILFLVKGGYLHTFRTQITTQWSTTAEWIAGFALVALVLAAARHYELVRAGRRSRIWQTVFLALLAAQLAYALPSGWRQPALAALLVPLVVAHYVLGHIRWKLVVAAGLVVVFFIFPVLNVYRTALSREADTNLLHPSRASIGALWHAAAEARTTVAGLGAAHFVSLSVRTFVERLNMVQIIAAIVRRTPSEWPFEWGRTFEPLWTSLAPPRFLIRKPAASVGGVAFAHQYHLIHPGDTLTSVAPTRLGELYLDFWLPGVVIGMWLEGVLARFVYAYLVAAQPRSPVGVVLYTMFALTFVEFTAFADYALMLKQCAVVLLLLIWMASPGRERGVDGVPGATALRAGE